ncbi:hypothetical protein IFR05_002370 [Cadophora sp. M221]|nr:hypothetical protein IFR05_002370 [Cadophora sp. M221]
MAVQTIPFQSTPRVVPSSTNSTQPTPLNAAISQEFYEALAISVVLGKNRHHPIVSANDDARVSGRLLPEEQRNKNITRVFMRSLAYLCACSFMRGSVTAIALRSNSSSPRVTYVCATNDDRDGKINHRHLEEILSMIKSGGTSTKSQLESAIRGYLKKHYHFGTGTARFRKSLEILVQASKSFPDLFDDFNIFRIDSSASSVIPKAKNQKKPDKIVESMFDRGEFKHKYGQSMKLRRGTGTFAENWLYNKGWPLEAKVHAELLIHDFFWKGKFKFFGDDPYIGCSKTACYCCYQYMKAHTGLKVILPSCSNDAYLAWRVPSITDFGNEDVETLIQTQKSTVEEMTKVKEHDIIQQLINGRSLPTTG